MQYRTLKQKARQNLSALIVLAAAMVLPQLAFAGTVAFDESEMETVFGQTTVVNAGGAIDFRIVANTQIADSELTAIESEAELDELWSYHFGDPLALNVFFVDDISWCGGFGSSIVGCGETPGLNTAIDSSWAASSFGTELIAHEIAHNLGLDHVFFPNLMSTALNNNTDLTASQATSIFSSPSVQFDNGTGTYFIEVALIAVVQSTTVPLPAAGLVLIGALGALGLARRRRRHT